MKLTPYGATVLVDGVQFTSAVDRIAEARAQVALVPEDAAEAWVYGPALGDAIRLLLERRALERLHVVIMNAELSAAVPDAATWRADPRVAVHAAADVARVFTPFVASPVELRFAEPRAHELRDKVMSVLIQPFNTFTMETLAPTFDRHEAANARVIATDGKVSDLFGRDERKAVVAGAGPSLIENAAWIREARREFNVIAASSALLPLLRAAIIPDVVLVLDCLPMLVRHFAMEGWEADAYRRTALVYNRRCDPLIPAAWRGTRYSMRDGDLYGGGSVIHQQADLAVQMGARAVHLVGVDLCFPGSRSHVVGAMLPYPVDEHAQMFRTVDGNGRDVATAPDLMLYRRTLEDLIERHRGRAAFVKHGRTGVPLRGAPWAGAMTTIRDALGVPLAEVTG